MHLFEETSQAQKLRRNIIALLESGKRENQLLAIEMIKTGGFHWELFLQVNLEFHRYHSFAISEQLVLDLLFQSNNSLALIKYIQDHLAFTGGLGKGPSDKIFKDGEFFELLIVENITDFQRLGELWRQDGMLQGNHHLMSYLIRNLDAFDPNLIFISPDIERKYLNRFEIKGLFECKNPYFDMLGFLKQYVRTGNKLDLSNTSIEWIPEEAGLLPNIEILDLTGTRVSVIPTTLLKTVRKVEGSKKTLKRIRCFVNAFEGQAFPLVFQFKMGDAVTSLKAKRYQTAFNIYRNIEAEILQYRWFSESDLGSFWEGYFQATFYYKGKDEALQILEKAIQLAPDAFGPFQWEWGEHYVREILRSGDEKKWIAAVSEIKAKDPRYAKVFNLSGPQFWKTYFHGLVSKGEIDEAFRMIRVASEYLELNSANYFPWQKFIHKLYKEGNWEGIIDSFGQNVNELLAWYEGEIGPPRHKMRFSLLLIEVFGSFGRFNLIELWIGNLHCTFNRSNRKNMLIEYRGKRYLIWELMSILKGYIALYQESRPVCARYFESRLAEIEDTQ